MVDTNITFTIPEAKVQRVIDATKFLWAIPTTTDEEGVTTNDFTDAQWAKEAWRRYIIAQVKRVETFEAKKEVSIETDDELVS